MTDNRFFDKSQFVFTTETIKNFAATDNSSNFEAPSTRSPPKPIAAVQQLGPPPGNYAGPSFELFGIIEIKTTS